MKIIVTDDDRIVAMSLKTIISADKDAEVIAECHSGEEAVEMYDKYLPDILLMDIRMQGMTGLEAGEMILKKHPDAKILYLTTFADDEYILKAVRTGAKGYILKQDFQGIIPALQAVMNGQTVYGEKIMGRLPDIMYSRNGFSYDGADISEREQEIIELVAQGLSNKEISAQLYLSEGTVRNYISTILEKLCLRDRTQLAVFYYKNIK
ncbi:MAG: response regulator transcription factor [Ruminococcus sp.]|nr:response regulator transcription factor [Ruminococcus sp.]